MLLKSVIICQIWGFLKSPFTVAFVGIKDSGRGRKLISGPQCEGGQVMRLHQHTNFGLTFKINHPLIWHIFTRTAQVELW